MKKFLMFLICFKIINASAQPYSLQWEKVFRGPLQNSNCRIIDAAVDNNDNFYFLGNRDTSINSKIFLHKYFPDGTIDLEFDYCEQYPNGVSGYGLHVDANENIFIAGWKYLANPDSYEFFILKFDSIGNLLWRHTEPATIDNNISNWFEIKLCTDLTGAVYYAFHSIDSTNVQYKLKCGKLNANGSQVWENYLPKNYNILMSFEIRSDNKLEIAISSDYYDSVSVSLFDTSFNALTSFGQSQCIGKIAYLDEHDNTYFVAEHWNSTTFTLDSSIVVKLDQNLNEIWTIYNNGVAAKDFINGNGKHLYWLNEFGISRIDTSGFIEWHNIVGSEFVESVEVNSIGNAYVSYTLGLSHDLACFLVYDSVGNTKQSRSYLDYVYPVSALNNNSDFMAGMWQATSGHYGNQVVYFDSSFTDSALYANLNYQHKIDIDIKSLMDHNHNIIDICRMTDTTIAPGSFTAYPCLSISKFDSSGIFSWRRNFQLATRGYYNFLNAFVDVNNNVYACGGTPGRGNYETVGFIVKVSADGTNAYNYFFTDSNSNGNFSINSIIADESGNVYAAGIFDTSALYEADAILIKIDSVLNPLWIKHLTIRTFANERAENIQFKNHDLVFTVASVLSGSTKIYICEYDTAGNQIWTIPVNSSFSPYNTKMKTDPSGNLFLAGISNPPAWFVVSLDSTGGLICEWRDTTVFVDWNNQVKNLIIDDDLNLYVVGDISDGISGNYCLRKFNNCNVEWTDTISGFTGQSISRMFNQIYTSTSNLIQDSSPVTIYDSIGTILFRTDIPSFQNWPTSILADTNSFYTSSSIRTDSAGVEVDIRRYFKLQPNLVMEPRLDSQVYLHPNPTTGQLRIHSSGKKLSNINFFNTANQIIYSQKLMGRNDEYFITLPASMNGEFLYSIFDDTNKSYNGIVIIIR